MSAYSTTSLSDALQELQGTAASKRTVFGTPIPWVAKPVFAYGFVVAPAYGAASRLILCSYQVPRGYKALLCGLVAGYVGGGGGALPGQVLFTVDVENPAAAVVNPQIGYTAKDYASVPFALGTLSPAEPWPVEFRPDSNETIRVKGQTVSSVPTGDGNFLFAALIGFQWPEMGWEG